MIKITIAAFILLLGTYILVGKIIKFSRDIKKEFKSEMLDFAFFYPFTGFILSLILVFVGACWLYHLLFFYEG